MNRFTNKVAVITGGSSGIGLAAARQLVAEGAQVVITGRSPDTMRAALDQLGPAAAGVISDAGDMSDVSTLPEAVRARHARIDIIIANAGIIHGAPVEQVTEREFDEQVDVNFKGVYFTVQALLPLMTDGGSIVLTGSSSARRGLASNSVYASTKAAVAQLARNLSADLLERRIRVNVVEPGAVDTPIFDRPGLPADQLAAVKQSIVAQVPVGRFASAEEVARLLAYLASDESAYIVGESIGVGGGFGTL